MGKRKKSTRKPAQRRAREPLPTVFSCLFCNHEKSVICRLDKKMNLGFLNCKICGQNFQTSITKLSVPVDIYSEWIDAVEGGEIQDPKQIGEEDISDLSERENDRDADEEEDEEDDIGLE